MLSRYNDFFKRTIKSFPLKLQVRYQQCCISPKPNHLICFKQWTANMVLHILESALSLKCSLRGTRHQRMNVLMNCKVMILQEVNEPLLNMAVSKASTLLGAYDVNIIDHLVWEQDYLGRAFSCMADAIFVATMTHMCVQRFADMSTVPVLCMRSRTHASIQALATIMAILEEFGTMRGVNVAYIGSPHPVLNSYLLLCPMLGANISFKCCCQKSPVSPLLYKAGEDMQALSHTSVKESTSKDEVLKNASVIIAGPSSSKNLGEFKLRTMNIEQCTSCNWIFFHTCPRGEEVDDKLFFHCKARTFTAFENFQYIAAALMANAIKGYKF